MKGAYFFVVFFLLFTSAIFFIRTPMFPAATLLSMLNATTTQETIILSTLINGVVYGLIAWAIFALAMRKIASPSSSKDSVKKRGEGRK